MPTSKNRKHTSSVRKLAAILFADIVGYTALMQTDEKTANLLLEKFHTTLNTKVPFHKGQVINNYGDGCVCTFDSAVDAMNCAKEVQSIFQAAPQVPVRIGLHSGDVFFKENNVYGDSVNIASRIESLGVAGAVLFSKRIKRDIANQTEFKVQSIGEFEFKNVEKTMEVFALANEGMVIPLPSEIKGKVKAQSPAKRKWWMAALVLLVGLLGVFFWQNKSNTIAKQEGVTSILPAEVRDKNVAVMIFDDQTNDQSLSSVGMMISDWISTGLMGINKGKVISAANVKDNVAYASAVGEAQQSFAERTGAEVLIQGRYYVVENQVFIHADIVDAYSGSSIKSLETISGDKAQIMELIDELTQKLLGYWATVGQNRYAKKPPKYAAFKLFLEAEELWLENDQLGEQKLKKAYEIDSTYFTALLKLCILYRNNGQGNESKELIEFIEKKNPYFSAYEQLRFKGIKASNNGNLSEEASAYEQLAEFDKASSFMAGYGNIDMNRPFRAIPYLKTAIENFDTKNRNYAEQRGEEEYLSALFQAEQYEEMLQFVDGVDFEWKGGIGASLHLTALAHANQWTKFDSLASTLQGKELRGNFGAPPLFLATFFLLNQDHPKAAHYLTECTPIVQALPDSLGLWKGAHAFFQENYEEAIKHYNKVGIFNGRIAACYHRLNEIDLAKTHEQKQIDLIQSFKDKNLEVAWLYYDLASYYAAIGDQEKTVIHLKNCYEAGGSFLWFAYGNDPTFKNLHGYPPFDEFIKPKG